MLRPARLARRTAAAPLLAAVLLAACAAPDAVAPADAPSLAKRASAPAAPYNVAAAAGDAQATVRWTPGRDGGSAILRYTVTSSPGGVQATVNAPATTATVAGLTNGTAYTFTVAATNAVGTSKPSSASAPVTPVGDAPPPPPPTTGRWLSGYYVGYQRALQPPASVDFSILTHLFVGRLIPTATGGVLTHFDITAAEGPAFAREMSARAHAANRKAVLMLGGAGEHAAFVGAASSANRARFVATLVATMDSLGYDGIDVDWEPINAEDRAPLLALLRELRAARPGMLLTIPVGWVNTNFPGSVDAWYAEVAQVVDQMNVMTYSMSGAYGGWVSWHTSALYDHQPNHPSSIQSSAARYVAVGVPAAKLGVGLPFYGQCWRGPTGPRQAVGSGIVAEDNTMSYRNIVTNYPTAARQWDDVAKAAYLSFPTATGPQGCTFVSYEDAQSAAAKGAYVRGAGLGGAIVWTIAQGHLPSAPEGQRDPVLRAAYDALMAP
jgi:chitinase